MPKVTTRFSLALCFAIGSTAAFGEPRTMTLGAYGPAHVGMTRQALETALGAPLKSEPPGEDSAGCEYAQASRGYEHIGFMLVNQRLARIDVDAPIVATTSGIRIGATQAAVLAAYPGRVEISPHAYTAPEGSYLTIYAKDHRLGLRFEIDQGRVVRFYTGTSEAIQYIEGCQ